MNSKTHLESFVVFEKDKKDDGNCGATSQGDNRLRPFSLHFGKESSVEQAKWYAIYTRSRFEKKLFRALRQSAFETFLPLVREKRVWSDRLKTVEVPLLPSYVFVKIPRNHLHKMYYYPGFVKFVCFEGKPCEVREEEIRLLVEIVENGFPVRQTSTCGVGDRVRITRGPLLGWEGEVERKNGSSRVVFSLDSIHLAVTVEVEMSELEKI